MAELNQQRATAVDILVVLRCRVSQEETKLKEPSSDTLLAISATLA